MAEKVGGRKVDVAATAATTRARSLQLFDDRRRALDG